MTAQRFIIALLIIAGFFAALGYMLHYQILGTDIMLGALVAAFALAPKWYFDSSHGSEQKTQLLARAPSIDAPPTPKPERIEP